MEGTTKLVLVAALATLLLMPMPSPRQPTKPAEVASTHPFRSDGVRDPPVDATTLDRKVLFGYQGWFSCPGAGSAYNPWDHWFRGPPEADSLTVDYWPDVSELTQGERCATLMTLPGGGTAAVFSSYRQPTVLRHFEWMRDYGIDGVFLQRFVTRTTTADRAALDQVARNVQAAAEQTGRVFALMYDTTGSAAADVSTLANDWRYLVDTLRITASPRYLHHDGRPVLGIWGLGFQGNAATPSDAAWLLGNLTTNASASYRAALVGGVPTYWRTLTGDSQTDPAWARVYRSFDVLSPWTVGRYVDNASADAYRTDVLEPDLTEASASNVTYMPVVFPGFSWRNLHAGPLNEIPRNGGHLIWRQAYNALAAGATMLYVAMFDEVDEGTAMFKLAPRPKQLPVGATLVPLNIDGYSLPSDWYLRVGREITKMTRGDIPLTRQMPIAPDTTPPVISIQAPQAGAVLQTRLATVRGVASDNDALESVEVSLEGASWATANGTTAWYANLMLAAGSDTIHARATDVSGNAASTSVNVSVQEAPPAGPSKLPVELGALLAATTVVATAFLLYRRRRRANLGRRP